MTHKNDRVRCERPCLDCPFRRDILPYSSPGDVANNILWLMQPDQMAMCHQTVPGCDYPSEPKTKIGCAGFLILRQKLGLKTEGRPPGVTDPPLADPGNVFDALDEYTLKAAMNSDDDFVRWLAWAMNQPRTQRNLRKFAQIIQDREVRVMNDSYRRGLDDATRTIAD